MFIPLWERAERHSNLYLYLRVEILSKKSNKPKRLMGALIKTEAHFYLWATLTSSIQAVCTVRRLRIACTASHREAASSQRSLFVSGPPFVFGSLRSITAQYAWNQTNTTPVETKKRWRGAPLPFEAQYGVRAVQDCIFIIIKVCEVNFPITGGSLRRRLLVYRGWRCRDKRNVSLGLQVMLDESFFPVHISTCFWCPFATDFLSFY